EELFVYQPTVIAIPAFDKNKAKQTDKIAKFHILIMSVVYIIAIIFSYFMVTIPGNIHIWLLSDQYLLITSLTPLPCIVSGYWGIKGRQPNFILPLIVYTTFQLLLFGIFAISSFALSVYHIRRLADALLFIFFLLLPPLAVVVQSFYALKAFIAVRKEIINSKTAFRQEQARALVSNV
ncbi:hypothetical protein PFISCL1PPCAC_25908, partial [Pristionchus fissidentatus]